MKEDKDKCSCNENCKCGDDCNCDIECKCDEKCNCNQKGKGKKDSKTDNKKDNKELKNLKEKYKLLEETNKILNEKVLRLSAEIQNIAKRHSEELSNLAKYEGVNLIKDLLPIVDNFERSIAMDTSVDEKYLEGYKLIYTNFLNILNNLGVKEIECQDKEFDPNLMDAIMTEHVDGIEAGYVLLVLQKGYIYKDKIIRHAFVKVSE